MFPLIRSALQRRFIHEGRVFCPTRGRDVEFDLCAGCALATDIQSDVEMPYVSCRSAAVPHLHGQEGKALGGKSLLQVLLDLY